MNGFQTLFQNALPVALLLLCMALTVRGQSLTPQDGDSLPSKVDSKFIPEPASFDLFNQPIDTREIYNWYERQAKQLLAVAGSGQAAVDLQNRLRNSSEQSSVKLSSLIATPNHNPADVYSHMVKSTLYIGEIYDCGRCSRIHASFAGGVVISEDGIALTNHHVIQTRDQGAKGIFAMTYDGRVWPIVEVLSASVADDLALIRLAGDGDYQFHAACLAGARPRPTELIRIISHPHGQFYVMTSGEVSRYSRQTKPRQGAPKDVRPSWMEVTAAFGKGSSGSGIFNANGEVVGLVSTIVPLSRKLPARLPSGSAPQPDHDGANDSDQPQTPTHQYVELWIRKCVPLDAIKRQFAD